MTDLNTFKKTDGVNDHVADDVNRWMASSFRSEFKNVETLSGTRTLLDADTPIQRFECGAADRQVNAPTGNTTTNHPFWIVNASAAARTITFKDSAGSATIGVIPQGLAMSFMPDGNGGYKIGGFWIEPGTSGNVLTSDGSKWISQAPASSGVTSGPQAFADNYVITPSISSNNLTVALKTVAGNDPSAGDPITIRIGNTKRTITSALSVTLNAGANTFNSGAAEHKTQDMDYFVYLGYNATDGVTIGFARIPWGRVYSDFNTTATNEQYCKISNIAHAASTDVYELIGRFNAANSGTASYNWSIPATAIVVNRPIYETRWLTWVPTITSSGGTPTTVTAVASYKVSFHQVNIIANITVTNHGTATGTMILTNPLTASAGASGGGKETNATGYAISAGIPGGNLGQIQAAKYDATTLWADTYVVATELFYQA